MFDVGVPDARALLIRNQAMVSTRVVHHANVCHTGIVYFSYGFEFCKTHIQSHSVLSHTFTHFTLGYLRPYESLLQEKTREDGRFATVTSEMRWRGTASL
jgi:hypothetical protein